MMIAGLRWEESTASRPDEGDAVSVAYGASGNTIVEGMRMPDGRVHLTVVTLVPTSKETEEAAKSSAT